MEDLVWKEENKNGRSVNKLGPTFLEESMNLYLLLS